MKFKNYDKSVIFRVYSYIGYLLTLFIKNKIHYNLNNRGWENWDSKEVIERMDLLYHKSMDDENTGRPFIINLLNNKINEGDKMLDAGCGPAIFYERLSKLKKFDYTGIDNSKKVVDYCKKKFKKANFDVSDLYNLNFKDNYFDIVLCVDVLEHVANYEKIIKELLRVSKKYVIIHTHITPGKMKVIKPNPFYSITYNIIDFENTLKKNNIKMFKGFWINNKDRTYLIEK